MAAVLSVVKQLRVLNLRHLDPDDLPPGVVRCDRATPWGNSLFRIGDPDPRRHPANPQRMTRDDVCDLFEEWFRSPAQEGYRRQVARALRGAEAVACWCTPARCHCDTYVRFMAEPGATREGCAST